MRYAGKYERGEKKIIQAFGGKIIFTPAEKSLPGSIKKVREITSSEPNNYFIADQFKNPHNPEVHYQQIAPAIWKDMKGKVDVLLQEWEVGELFKELGNF